MVTIGIGDVSLKMANGSTWNIHKVKHVPKLIRNLIFVGQLDDEGYAVSFSNRMWKVTKGAMVIAHGTKDGSLYTNLNCKDMVAVADVASKVELWHNRLEHMSEQGMKILHSNQKLPGLKTVEQRLCESYIYANRRRSASQRKVSSQSLSS